MATLTCSPNLPIGITTEIAAANPAEFARQSAMSRARAHHREPTGARQPRFVTLSTGGVSPRDASFRGAHTALQPREIPGEYPTSQSETLARSLLLYLSKTSNNISGGIMLNRQFILKTILLLTIATIAISCSNGKVDMGTDLSSRSGTVTPAASIGTPSSAGLLARCNQKTQGALTANLAVYKDASGNVRDDYMKLKFTQLPSDFAGGSYFEFFRWKDQNGQPYLDSTPVQARIETMDGTVLTDFSNVIYWNQVYAIAAQSGTTDPATFFKYVRLVLNIRDVNAEYDVLKIAYYSPTSQLQMNMDMLLPSFYVVPAEYANDKGTARPSFLQALHPFANTQALSSEQLKATADTYCF